MLVMKESWGGECKKERETDGASILYNRALYKLNLKTEKRRHPLIAKRKRNC